MGERGITLKRLKKRTSKLPNSNRLWTKDVPFTETCGLCSCWSMIWNGVKKSRAIRQQKKMVLVVDDGHNQFSLVLSSLSATLSSVWQYNSCINGYSVWIHSYSLSLSWPVVILYGAYARYIANWSDCLFGRPLLHRRDRRGPWMGDRCSSVVACLSIQLIFPYPLSVRLFLEFSNSFKLRLLSYRSSKKINDQNTRNEVK